MRRTALILATLVLTSTALSGCARGSDPAHTPQPTDTADSRATVDWENYPPDFQRLIDESQEQNDCDTLQGMFEAADTADNRQRERTGDGNTDLMTYIDEALKLAGCY